MYQQGSQLDNYFRGIVEDQAAMLAFPNISADEYLGRIDTGTLWKYNGSTFSDTGKPFEFSSIVNLEQEMLSLFNSVTELQESVQSIVDNRLYENEGVILNSNIAIAGGEQQGLADPLGQRAGWYFKNSSDLTNKINWYYIGNLNPQQVMTYGTLDRLFAVVTFRSVDQIPFFSVYSARENDGQDASWYRSRKTFANYGDHSALIGQQVLLHVGDDSNIFPSLPRIELTLDTFSSAGPQDPNEDILFGALSTSTSYPAGTYEFVVEKVGYVNSDNRMDYELQANPADVPVTTLEYADTHYIHLDATNDYLDLSGTGNALNYLENWSLGISFEDLSTIQDNTFIVLYRSGINTITLRKGGTNWGIYCFQGPNSVAQANTWYAPQPGSKALIQCNGTKIQYYLDGSLRANMTMNSNKNNSGHIVDSLQVGKGGTSSYQGALNYWYGGINNLFVSPEYMGSEQVAEYFSADDVSAMSFYEDIIDFCTLGENAYPTVLGLKETVSGTLENGTESDFVERT